jgi:hypothetical protein
MKGKVINSWATPENQLVLYKKENLWVMYPAVIARQRLTKDIAETKNCWKRR